MTLPLRTRCAAVVLVGVLASVIAHLVDAESSGDALVLLGAGIVLGELLLLRLEDGSGIPLSYAVAAVLAASFDFAEFAVVVVAAELAAIALRSDDRGRWWRVVVFAQRCAAATAAFGAYWLVREALDRRETVAAHLTALGAAAAALFVTDVVSRIATREHSGLSTRGRMAWLALVSSAILMAVGYRGVDGGGEVGIWGPLLFSTPLLAAWYSFERLHSITGTYRQTIEALSMAPELGGVVRGGHAQRVALLVRSLGSDLGLSARELADLEQAALLHHLGQLMLDHPEATRRPTDPSDVATVTSDMLRSIAPLSAAGDIVAGDGVARHARLGGQILRIASAYDDLKGGDETRARQALEALVSAPGYVYDGRVLDALARIVRTGDSVARV